MKPAALPDRPRLHLVPALDAQERERQRRREEWRALMRRNRQTRLYPLLGGIGVFVWIYLCLTGGLA